jgi:arylsulfatase A-like enzyme
MFTSRWDTQIAQRLEGKHPYPIDDSEVTLAEVLQKAGYDTSAVLPDPYFEPHHWRGITAGFRHVDTDSYRRNRSPHNAATVTDIALEEVRKERRKPLFLWVHYYDAHSPHIMPEGADGARSQRRTPSQTYDAELSLVDREVGRLIEGLDADPKGEPLIVLTADHGIDFTTTHHAKFNYGYDLYSSVLHVPLIVRVPGGPAGRREHVVSTMDIAPTLTNALRLKGRFPFQGVSLVRERASEYENPSRRLVHQFYIFENYWKDQDPLEKIALRTDRFNLIHDRRKGSYELYDWRADYFEAKDLIDDPDVAANLKDLRKQLAFYTYSLHRRPAPTPGTPAPRRRP